MNCVSCSIEENKSCVNQGQSYKVFANTGGALECQDGVSGSSKNLRKCGIYFTIQHCTCVTLIGYQIHVKLV